MNDNLRALLVKHEGLRLKPYKCSAGKVTIGVGRNLDDVGITEFEANLMLNNDITRVQNECLREFAWIKSLDQVRQDVVFSMVFNLGMPRFKGFKKFIEALRVQNYAKAADEMLSSLWAQQVGLRAQELSDMMLLGRYPITK